MTRRSLAGKKGLSSLARTFRAYCRGLNNYLYYFGGFLIIIIVYWAPKPFSNYFGPYITRRCYRGFWGLGCEGLRVQAGVLRGGGCLKSFAGVWRVFPGLQG